MRTARIILIWLIVTSASIVPALAEQADREKTGLREISLIVTSAGIVPALSEQQADREKAGLLGPVRTIVENSGILMEGGSPIFSLTRTYDIQGRLAEMEFSLSTPSDSHTDIRGRTVYTYGEKGKIFGTGYKDGNVSSTSLSIRDANGRPTEFLIHNPQGVLTFKAVHRYDDRGNKTETIIYKSGGTIAFRSLYTYDTDANGKVENVISYRSDGSVDYKARTRYDNKGHMLEEVFSRADATTDERRTYIYNENGQEQEKVVYNSEESIRTREASAYEYDSVGNWIKRTTQKLVSKEGKLIPELPAIVERVISYY